MLLISEKKPEPETRAAYQLQEYQLLKEGDKEPPKNLRLQRRSGRRKQETSENQRTLVNKDTEPVISDQQDKAEASSKGKPRQNRNQKGTIRTPRWH